jgi:hypothetical protein
VPRRSVRLLAALCTATVALSATACSAPTTNAAKAAIDAAAPTTVVSVELTDAGFVPSTVVADETVEIAITIAATDAQQLRLRRDGALLLDAGLQPIGAVFAYRSTGIATVIEALPSGATLDIVAP